MHYSWLCFFVLFIQVWESKNNANNDFTVPDNSSSVIVNKKSQKRLLLFPWYKVHTVLCSMSVVVVQQLQS